MNIHPVLAVISMSILIYACKKEAPVAEPPLVHPSDYAVAFGRTTNEDMARIETDIAFWKKKLAASPNGNSPLGSLAGLYAVRSVVNGKIEDVFLSDSIYLALEKKNGKNTSSGTYRGLATNCISQHKFRQALKYVEKAMEIGDGMQTSLFILTDVDIELGDLNGARSAISKIGNKNFYPYMIREAKLQDHEGHGDSAVAWMERAYEKVERTPLPSVWTLSILADMYSHENRLKDAYDAYVKVIKIDPDYDMALKGIALLAFSHDHNYAEAKRIASYIDTRHANPDMHLLLAQIASVEKDTVEKKKQLDHFVKGAMQPKYGDMYNKYLAQLNAEEFNNPDRTIEIAKREIDNRPTPQSYDLLAWGLYHKGDVAGAVKVAEEQVVGKTFEPDAYYHLAMIYSAAGKRSEAEQYFEKAEKSSFELGPEKAEKIKSELHPGNL